MNEDEFRSRVVALIDTIPSADAPVADLVRSGEKVCRRRAALAAVVTAVAAAAMVGTIAVIGLIRSGEGEADDRLPVASDSSTAPTDNASTDTVTAPVDLEGRWIVTALVGPSGHSVLNTGWGEVWVKFESGRLTADTGCNSITGGRYEQSGEIGEDIVISGRLTTTLVGCFSEDGLNVETPLMQRLPDVRHASSDGDLLQLHSKNWMIIAVLRRAHA